jgi:dipeptidyl aminopeptidase/acylaminoacyl peptidase
LSGNPSEPAISPGGGRLAISQRVSKYDIVRVDLEDASGEPLPFASSTRFDGNPQYSPDGKRVLLSSSRSGAVEIWTADADGRNARQLTFLGVAGSPKWSPDGERVAFDTTVDGDSNIYVVDAAGGDPVRITTSPEADYVPTWSADGKWIYFASDRAGSPQIWKIASDGGSEPVMVTTGSGIYGNDSPDCWWVYYGKSRSRDTAIWRLSTETDVDEPVIEDVSAGWSNWELGPEGVYYIDDVPARDGAEGWGVYLRRFGAAESEMVARLLHPPTAGAPGFSVSPDGKYALAGQVTIESDLMLVSGDFR